MCLLVNALTDVGLVRKDNEDSYLVSAERGLFVVADGMGGHDGGKLASRIAISVLDRELNNSAITQDPLGSLHKALLVANNEIRSHGKDDNLIGMGTTVTAALFYANNLHIAHIGDSRAYLFSNNIVTLLTQDHSLVNELFQKGSITLEEAQNHPQRNILTRALGSHNIPEIDLFSMQVQKGDLLVLCTDGLYNYVNEKDMFVIIGGQNTLDKKVRCLVDMALDRGGSDNITVVLVQYE